MGIEAIGHTAVPPANTEALKAAKAKNPAPSDTSESRILPTGSLFDAVGVVLDLSSEARDVMGAVASLEGEERNMFLDIIASVFQQGVVGTETLEVDGQPYESFVTTRLGDPKLMHAKPYQGGRLDVIA